MVCDGVSDGSSETTTTLNDNGIRETISEIRYANGDLRYSEVVFTSRDGQTVTTHTDYDGNGYLDMTSELTVRSDGERVLTETSFDETGTATKTFVTTTSLNGLIQTIDREGTTQTIVKAAIGNGSYTWTNVGAGDAR